MRTPVGQTDWFLPGKGVQQGSVLSPILFNAVMREIRNTVLRENDSTDVKTLMYADDIMIWGDNEKELESSLQKWGTILNQYGLKINENKTVVMTIS